MTTRSFAKALVGFAMICGVVVLLTSSSTGAERASADNDAVLADAISGLAALQRAQHALQRSNYGQLAEQISAAQEAMTRILYSAGGVPSKTMEGARQ